MIQLPDVYLRGRSPGNSVAVRLGALSTRTAPWKDGMAAPATIQEFVDLVRRSQVVDERRLDQYVEKLRAGGTMPADSGKLAGHMVQDGVLTLFQAEQMLLGRWRRFSIGNYKVLE